MNIIVSPRSHPTHSSRFEPLDSTPGIGNSLRAHSHPRRTTEATPALSREGPAGTRPGTNETRTIREETHRGYQEKCKGWSTGQHSEKRSCGSLVLTLGPECVQSDGQGPRPDTTLRPKVLPNANTASGGWSTYTNPAVKPTNGGSHARGHSGTFLPIAYLTR